MRGIIVAASVGALALLATGCGDDGGQEVDVALGEFAIEPEDDSLDAGEVTFNIENEGGETHEFLVVRADSADDLPVDDDGAFDEASFSEDDLVDEVEDVESGESAELTVDLDEGTYVLLCNIVEEEDSGEMESHFAEGMHTTITVE